MDENLRTLDGLKMMQAAPLSVKIRMTMSRIADWVNEYGEEGVYISFSGGKDSTVLLDIIRNRCGYKRIPAVFVDVPTQYPELKAFVKTFDNVEIIKPKMGFYEVCKKWGFPLITKEVSDSVYDAKRFLQKVRDGMTAETTRGGQNVRGYWAFADIAGIPRRLEAKNSEEYLNLKKGILPSNYVDLYQVSKEKAPVRLKALFGEVPHKEKGKLTNEYSKRFDRSKYKFFLEADFDISGRCCKVMKKQPLHNYNKQTGRMPITAQMADESLLRTSQWIKNGCNGFQMKSPISNPMSFWVENDVLQYIVENHLPICSVYGEVVEDRGEQLEGQMSIADYGLGGDECKTYKTTGCHRTGCVLCGFGCHLEKPGEGRFEKLKETHPKMYKMIDLIENNGVTLRQAIEWTNEHGGFDIRT